MADSIPISHEEALKLCKQPNPATKDFIFQQTMFRIKDPKVSLPFYTETLGMRLLQKMDFPEMKFSLYFMGFEEAEDIVGELGTRERTEWAISRKATLELTHNWGTENDADFKYHNGNSEPRGFGTMTGQTLDPHGPPRVDRNPLYLDSFLPAGMQVISHATELMKYEIPTTEVPTSTTPPSTSSHKPGIFAPNPTPSGIGFKNRARSAYLLKNSQFFGKIHADLFNRVNGIDDYDEILTQDQKVERFLGDYDDSPVTYLRKKKPPPPKAYVTLLSLYDNLNREAKKLGMNKYAGYTSKVLAKLSEFSKGNSANQMREIFSKIVDRKEVRQENTIKTLKVLIDDLKDPKSYLNDALRYIPPLNFNSDV